MRDDRPAGDRTAPAVWFAYSPDRKGEHPQRHLADFRGTLQADAYAGFNRLYDSGRIQEAACWAHVRRKFFDLHEAHASPIATEALERIGRFISLNAKYEAGRRRNDNEDATSRSRPLLIALHEWFKTSLGEVISEVRDVQLRSTMRSDAGLALVRYCEDGLLEIDNNASRTGTSCRRARSEELSVCWVRCWR